MLIAYFFTHHEPCRRDIRSLLDRIFADRKQPYNRKNLTRLFLCEMFMVIFT